MIRNLSGMSDDEIMCDRSVLAFNDLLGAKGFHSQLPENNARAQVMLDKLGCPAYELMGLRGERSQGIGNQLPCFPITHFSGLKVGFVHQKKGGRLSRSLLRFRDSVRCQKNLSLGFQIIPMVQRIGLMLRLDYQGFKVKTIGSKLT